MDIADIEMVVVHGVPDTVSQFYQVTFEISTCTMYTCISTYMYLWLTYLSVPWFCLCFAKAHVYSFMEELVVVAVRQEPTCSSCRRKSLTLCWRSIVKTQRTASEAFCWRGLRARVWWGRILRAVQCAVEVRCHTQNLTFWHLDQGSIERVHRQFERLVGWTNFGECRPWVSVVTDFSRRCCAIFCTSTAAYRTVCLRDCVVTPNSRSVFFAASRRKSAARETSVMWAVVTLAPLERSVCFTTLWRKLNITHEHLHSVSMVCVHMHAM